MDRHKEYPPGSMIPGTVYRAVRVIGAGGMGTVYDVEDTTVGKRYVLKTLHAELSNRRDLAKRMEAEARTLARLSHPNIVEVVTAGATTDELRLPYYVMEKLNGQNLRTILSKKGSLDLPHALHIAIDLLDALDNAHDKGVIHRDVKPDNIFLHRNPNGVTTTKLLDFGIMRLLDAGPGVTAGRFMGTLRYAAPEQLRGETLSPQTDLYAAALVLYEMIAGCGPFDDRVDANKIAAAHIQALPPPFSRWRVTIPESLEMLVIGALAKESSKRPKDAFTFAAHLRSLKRTLQVDRARDSETSRPTDIPVAGLVTSSSSFPSGLGPSVSSGGSVSTSGASPQAFATTERANTRAAKTPAIAFPHTMVGMTAPPATGATLVNASVAGGSPEATREPFDADATRGSYVPPMDRNAPTHSVALETPRSPEREGPHSVLSGDAATTEPWHPHRTLRIGPQPLAARTSDLIELLPTSDSMAARSDVAASSTLVPGKSRPNRPLATIGIGALVTGTLIATLTLAVWGVRRHANAHDEPTTGGHGTIDVAPPATAPFAAPILAPPFDTDPSPSASTPVASAAPPPSAVPTATPSSVAGNTTTVAEPPQRLRARADSVAAEPVAATHPGADRVPASSNPPLAPSAPEPARSAAKHRLPGSGL